MAFDFGSDIVVDAMRAADPAKVAEAKAMLQQLSAKAAAKTSDAGDSFAAGLRELNKAPVKPNREAEVLKKFEAVILTTFVQNMMPKNAESVFGEGLAGDMWKSQMAEKIAEQLSERGGIGIANRLLKDYQKVDDQVMPVSGVRDAISAMQNAKAADGATQFLHLNELSSLLKSENAENHKQGIIPPVGKSL